MGIVQIIFGVIAVIIFEYALFCVIIDFDAIDFDLPVVFVINGVTAIIIIVLFVINGSQFIFYILAVGLLMLALFVDEHEFIPRPRQIIPVAIVLATVISIVLFIASELPLILILILLVGDILSIVKLIRWYISMKNDEQIEQRKKMPKSIDKTKSLRK